MSDPVPAKPPAAGFRYADLPAADRGWLAAAADRVRSLAYRTACDMIRTGLLLADARGRLAVRTFALWVEAELPWSRAHAYRLIAVGELFGPLVDPAGEERIDPTALYLLARAEVPAGARAYAVELAAGRRVTAADAREILSAYRRVPDPPAAELKALDDRRALRPPDPAAPAPPRPPPVDHAELWAAVCGLVAGGAVLHVAAVDEDEDDPVFSVTLYAAPLGPRNFVRRWLSDAVLAACGREPTKRCGSCRVVVAASLFGDNADQADGREPTCKRCSRRRLAAVKKRAKEKKKKGRTES